MIEYTIIRMKRKSISLRVNDDLSVVVKAPHFVSKKNIDAFVSDHEKWILESLEIKKKRLTLYNEEYMASLRSKGKRYLDARMKYFTELTGLNPSSVGITHAKTRFGSCSGKNSINFSVYLFAYPDDVIDYVILHELCHIKYKDHSKNFYSEIEQYMPDYKDRVKALKLTPNIEKNS